MSWPVSIFIAILSGALGLVCAALISQLCVGWYRISSFEGGSGYFVVFTALLGGLAALAIGLVVARLMAAGAAPVFLKGLGAALGAVLVIALVALAICRLFADLAPKLDGLARWNSKSKCAAREVLPFRRWMNTARWRGCTCPAGAACLLPGCGWTRQGSSTAG
ncbi:MAG: hypothetical protein IPI73_26310 [Betaproteobacteria bacterium]|nr:hypothetical protein [Betaproteobacteria bacterium]